MGGKVRKRNRGKFSIMDDNDFEHRLKTNENFFGHHSYLKSFGN
jgi:hypothetical protein